MKTSPFLVFLFGIALSACTQTTFKLVPTEENYPPGQNIARFELDQNWSEGNFRLMADTGTEKKEIPYQRNDATIYWKLHSEGTTYFLEKKSPARHAEIMMSEKDGQLEIRLNNQKVIGYQMEIQNPPEGVSQSYQRNGYLHPVNTLKGKRLTRIQPSDHYHHYGIWNPWTHTVFEGDTLDFWNLYKEQGTVRFAKMLKKTTGPVFSEFEVLHEHVVLKNQKNKIALNETQNIKIFPLTQNQYLIQITINYQCATDEPFQIIKYRYGGFGWRTTEEWNAQNSRVLSSEGTTRINADGSKARWCIVDGQLGNDYGGALVLSHPENFNHPEPLRVWPEDQNERGDLFFNFATTKTTNWTFNPGETYTLKYQLIVYDGEMDVESAEQAWNHFAKPFTFKLNP